MSLLMSIFTLTLDYLPLNLKIVTTLLSKIQSKTIDRFLSISTLPKAIAYTQSHGYGIHH